MVYEPLTVPFPSRHVLGGQRCCSQGLGVRGGGGHRKCLLPLPEAVGTATPTPPPLSADGLLIFK